MRFELVAASVGRLGEAEFVQDATALTLLGRLVERPLEIGDGGVGGAPGAGLVGRRPQDAHPRWIACRREAEDVPRDALALRPSVLHQRGRPRVQALPFQLRNLAVHRRADHGMDEVELDVAVSGEHVDRDERIGGGADRARRQLGQRRDVA